MANVKFTNGAGTGNIQTAGNYQGGAAPSNGDTVLFDDIATDINAGNDWSAGPTNLSFVFGKNWKGQFGRQSTPIKLNASTGSFRVRSPNAGGIYAEFKNSGGMGNVEIAACGQGANVCRINGDITRFAANGPGVIVLGSAVTLNEPLFVDGHATVTVESGAAGASSAALSILQMTGIVDNYASLAYYYGIGGQLNHWGSEAGNTGGVSGAMQTYKGNLIRWRAARQNTGYTLALLKMLGGTFDDDDIAAANTLTLLELAAGTCRLNPGWTVSARKILAANALNSYSGPSPASEIPMAIYGR